MDQNKTGSLIRVFRTKMGLTQKQLADRICVSDKAVSKWEVGSGFPDLSLLAALAEVFNTDISVLLDGEIERNESETGNMKKLRFYVCKECGNIITAATDTAVTCCGNKLTALEPKEAEENDRLKVKDIGVEWFISSDHEMTKEHYISFVAYIGDNSLMMFRQYPEWNIQITMPMYRIGKLVWYCNKHGLLYQPISPRKR